MRGVTLEIGGKTRRLRYDLNAIAELGDRLGLRVRLDHFKEDLMGAPLPLASLRVVLWAGLIHEEASLTPEVVGGWVDTDNMGDVLAAFFELFGARLPEKNDRQAIADKLGIELPEGSEVAVAGV